MAPGKLYTHIYAANGCMPVLYRFYTTDIREIKACKLTLKERGVITAVIIGD